MFYFENNYIFVVLISKELCIFFTNIIITNIVIWWGPGAVSGEWEDVCGFLKLPDSHEKLKVRFHDAFSTPHSALGLREKDQSFNHGVWTHLALTNPRRHHAPRDKHDQRQHLKERSAPYQRNKGRSRAQGEQSDHSHSS